MRSVVQKGAPRRVHYWTNCAVSKIENQDSNMKSNGESTLHKREIIWVFDNDLYLVKKDDSRMVKFMIFRFEKS